MKNFKDDKTKIYPSTMRGGKELPSSSALDSPSVLSVINSDINIDESDDESFPNKYELPVVPEGYVMDEETKRDFLACNDRSDLKKLLAKLKQKTLNARMKYDPAYASSPIFVADKDYKFSIDPDIITLVESNPFYG